MAPQSLLAQLEFSQLPPFELRPEHVMTYIGLTLVFLFIVWLYDTKSRPLGTNLIVWGILVATLAGGYALIGVPTMMLVTPTLMKIAFILVLGGVAWCLLTPGVSSAATPNRESDHV